MNFEAIFSLLGESNWFFLTGLILLLGVAFADTFSEKPAEKRPSGSDRTPPR